MKKSKYIVVIIGLLLFSTSCSNSFLDLAPISNMNEGNFFKTEADFRTAIDGAYKTLYDVYSPDGGVLSHTEQMSDNCTLFHVANNSEEQMQLLNYTILTNNGFVLSNWNTYYNSLFIINTIIDKLPGSSISASSKTQYEAEMKFLRALYYFNMVRLWGDVPLIIKPVTVAESYSYGRAPAADVYAQIISDLLYAESNLPVLKNVVRVGQPTIGAAQGLLGKVYATSGDVANAKIYLKKVIDAKEYSLLPAYSQLWDLKHENSTEALFEIQFIRGVGKPGSRYTQAYSPDGKIIYGGGQNPVTDNLWNEYETGDVRRDLSIYQNYVDAGVTVAYKYPKKWADASAVAVGSTYYSENNFIVLRYADVLLMYAELAQDTASLNQVRRRAGVPTWGNANYPIAKYPTLNLAIEHERRVELALEFQRWFDLKRTSRATTVISAAKGKTITDPQLLLPIPQVVIDQNPTILKQNPGYQ